MSVKVVPAGEGHWEFIRRLRTHPDVQAGFIEQHPDITPEQQRRYMAVHGKDYFVALVDERPAGYIGVVDDDIRVCVHPDFQGAGVGTALIRHVMGRYPRAQARVKAGNEASLAAFRKAGFENVVLLD